VQARTRRRRRKSSPSPAPRGPVAPPAAETFGVPPIKKVDIRAPAREKTRAAHEALPGQAVRLPILPKLHTYTDAQRNEVVRATTKAIHQYRDAPLSFLDLGRKPSLAERAARMRALPDLVNSGDARTREALHKFEGAQARQTKIANVLLGRYIQHRTGAKGDPEALGKQAQAPNPNVNPQARTRAAPEHMKFGGQTKIAGVPLPGVHQALYSTGKILEQFDRPLHATAGAIYAAQHGGNPARAALRGLENKDHYTTSDIMPAKSGNSVVDFAASLGGGQGVRARLQARGGQSPRVGGGTQPGVRGTRAQAHRRAHRRTAWCGVRAQLARHVQGAGDLRSGRARLARGGARAKGPAGRRLGA
jgi:hypothetical protein